MWNRISPLTSLILAISLTCITNGAVAAADEVLATVGNEEIHSSELESAIASSPFSTQFNTMGENEQASLRGDMLRRIVSAHLLAQEAKHLKLDQTPAFKRDMEDFRLGLLYRAYMDKLRAGIKVPEDVLAEMKQQFKGDADALSAAQASYIAARFRELKADALKQLLVDNDAKYYVSRIQKGIKPNTVLMEATGLRLTYGEVVDTSKWKKLPNVEWIQQQLHDRGELMLVARAAERDGVDVSAQLANYGKEKLPALMLERKSKEWVPGEKAMRKWYSQHQDVGRISASYHVGQLVVATREEAEAMRARILKGESLFNLAGSDSIDPVGRSQNGDMGWITEGRGMPELIKVLPKLKDEELSEVIQTPSGYHLVMVLERRIGRQKSFTDVAERVRQMMINEKIPAYMGELEKRYPVSWHLMAAEPPQVTSAQ